MLSVRYRKNIMLKSLQLFKDGYRGLTSASSSAQSLSQESKRAPSKLKENIVQRVNQVTLGMKESPIILSVLGQALATTNEQDLLKMIRIVHNELENLLIEFDDTFINDMEVTSVGKLHPDEIKVLEIGDTVIQQVTFVD